MPINKSRFVVSFLESARPTNRESLFIAEPFIYHYMQSNGFAEDFLQIEVAPYIRKTPYDLKSANTFLWKKYETYLPLLSERLNFIHSTDFTRDFWRRALSMGLMRHLTLVYDFFNICETYLDPRVHTVSRLSNKQYHVPQDYNEQRWFLQHSHFGQEQLLSLYLRCFYPGLGHEFQDQYHSNHVISSYRGNIESDPVVGVMGALFRTSFLDTLIKQSKGHVNTIGYTLDFLNGSPEDARRREMLLLENDNFDRFDKYFFFTMPTLFPRAFLEDFLCCYHHISSQLGCYKQLRYVVSETFIGETYESIALSILSQRGVNVIYNEHNYSEYPFYSTILEQQTSFADIFAAHGNYTAPVKNMIPSGSLFEFQPDPEKVKDLSKVFHALYISGVAVAKYSNYAHSFGETAEHAEHYYSFKTAFFKALNPALLPNIVYRPYPRDDNSRNWNLCYDDSVLMRSYVNRMQIDDLSCTSKVRMFQSRLVIVDYLSTSHLESMSMNIPTVIFIRQECYVLNKEHQDYFDELMSVGVIQSNPTKAAQFVESIWNNPESWWFKPEVQTAKDRFLEKNLGKPEYLIDFLLKLGKGTMNRRIGDTRKISLSAFLPDQKGVYNNPINRHDFGYSDGEAREDHILDTLESVQDLSIFSGELRENIHDWVSEYHFCQERHNLLRHLNLRSDMKILELGCGCGAITRQLGESGAKVTAVEGSIQRAWSAAARSRDLSNIRVYCSKFQDIMFTEKYDVVTFIGVLEYTPQYFNSDDPIADCLKIACDALKPNGILIVAIENQLGLKYFCGLREDHADIPYFGIEDRYDSKTAITFGRQELKNILHAAGLSEIRFHYPFPDYKIPKAIFTGKAFENPSFMPEEIIRQIASRDYSGELETPFDEKLAVPVLCRNGLMQDFSNSFLVIASRTNLLVNQLYDQQLLAAVYTTDRNNAYNVQTRFIQNENTIIAEKMRLLPGPAPVSTHDVLSHAPKDEIYVAGRNLEAEYRRCVVAKDYERLSRLLELQLKFLVHEALQSKKPDNPVVEEIKSEFFDCIPSNLILHDGCLDYINQEWKLNRRVTFGALLLKTVDALHELDKSAPELSRENLICILGRLGFEISAEVIKEYNALIAEVDAQIYRGENQDTAHVQKLNDSVRNRLETVRSIMKYLPKPDALIQKLYEHLDQMLMVRNGYSAEGYLEKAVKSIVSREEETAFCSSVSEMAGDDPDWCEVKVFINRLIFKLS